MYQEPSAVTLSTYFLGGVEIEPATASTKLGNFMALKNVANATREDALRQITYDLKPNGWAACSAKLLDQGAVLPCRTGDLPARCINGAEHCGTIAENTHEPWAEIDLREGVPTDRDYYFFALEVDLPPDPELGSLFFQSSQGISEDRGDVTNRYYEIEVFDLNHNPLSIKCKPYFKQSVDVYADGMAQFQYVCLDALASDDAYVIMRHVRYVRVTLLGDHRLLWLNGMRVMWRTVNELPPATPPPPPVPPMPPSPGAPPDAPDFGHGCHEYTPSSFTFQAVSFGDKYSVAFEEPCGLSASECCRLAYEHTNTAAFHLSPSGCCTLLNVPEADHAALAATALKPTVVETPHGTPGKAVVAVTGVRMVVGVTY